jgi:hypothetical protein
MTYAIFALAIATFRALNEDLVLARQRYLPVQHYDWKSECLAIVYFFAQISGCELKGDEDQAASTSGRANDYPALPVPGVNPCLCLPLSDNGLSTTDDFGLRF